MALPSVCMGSLKVAQAELTPSHRGRREHGKKRSSLVHLTVTECTGEVGGRCERRREPGELKREWEKCDMLPANGDAASHAPDRRSISAAGNRGLDVIFSSAVASARLSHIHVLGSVRLWWFLLQVGVFW